MKGQVHTLEEQPAIQLKPIISYPRTAKAGETYLLTIDAQLAAGSPWPYQEEEFEISFLLETAPFFTHEPLEKHEPGIVLHRFGSTYGAAEYLLKASEREVAAGHIKIALLNGWGLPVAQLKLECEVKQDAPKKAAQQVTIKEARETKLPSPMPPDITTSPAVDATKISRKKEYLYEEEYVYEIEKIIASASALVCIARPQGDPEQRLVFKILREYKDERYHYASAKERLECQKEALRKNRQITPAIYLGLARMSPATLLELEEMKRTGRLQSIVLGPIVQESEQIEQISEQDGEYALVMSYLAENQRLDLLLEKKVSKKQEELYLHALALRIEQMHKNFLFPPTEADEHGYTWGSYEQLLKKLEHNLIHLDLIERHNLTLYEEYSKLIQDLKANVRDFIEQRQLRDAFKERLQHGYIRQCHGNLKTNNIWIETIKQDDNFLQHVRILDAVDFNESYRNIDVLADLAMLVVDVEAFGGEELGAFLEENYLSLTNQIGDAAKLVMAYYCLEKAIVCAIVCIVYDHCEPYMGQRFLELANKHANELRYLINS